MIAIIVEGVSDRGFIEGIADRLKITCRVRLMRGNRPNKAVRLIKSVSVLRDINKIIFLKDLHAQDENKIRDKIRGIMEEIGEINKVYPIVVKKSIESWVLAGLYNKRDAEKIADPIRELNTLLMREGRYYIKSYDFSRRLAEMIDLNKAMRNSHSFRKFINLLKN